MISVKISDRNIYKRNFFKVTCLEKVNQLKLHLLFLF